MRDAFLRISLPLPFLFRHPRLFPSVILPSPTFVIGDPGKGSSVFVFAFVAAPSLVKARDMPSWRYLLRNVHSARSEGTCFFPCVVTDP